MPLDPKERAYWDWRLDDFTSLLRTMIRRPGRKWENGKMVPLPPLTPEERQQREAEYLRYPLEPVYESPEEEAIYRQELARLRAEQQEFERLDRMYDPDTAASLDRLAAKRAQSQLPPPPPPPAE